MGSGNTKGRRAVIASEEGKRFNAESNTNEQTSRVDANDITMKKNAERTNTNANPSAADDAGAKENDNQPGKEPEATHERLKDKEITAEAISKDQIRAKFVNENPKLERTFRKGLRAIEGITGCLDSGNLFATESSPGVNAHITLLSDLYYKHQYDPSARFVDFLTALGFPKLACDLLETLKKKFPKITTDDFDGSEQKEKDNKDDEEKREVKSAQDFLTGDFTRALVNCTDLNDDFCIACAKEGLVATLVEMSEELKTCVPNIAEDEIPKKGRGGILRRFTSILHNLSRRAACKPYFTNCHAVETLASFLKVKPTVFSTKGLLILAYLIDEKNNKAIMSDEGPIASLIEILEKAQNNEADHRRYRGFSNVETAEGLGKIALNDNNKKLIGKHNAIPILVKMIKEANTEEEKFTAAETLWILAFDKENKNLIREDKNAMSVLRDLRQGQEKRARKAAAGVLWELGGEKEHSKQTSAQDSSQHIMISYQWDVQEVVLQVRDKLRALGFKVWVDVDEMGGSTLESMAKAVENAAVVLMCVSQKYKDSPNCRSEAEYTYKLNRDIIPLMMDINYEPDGWLGILLGVKFWIDFHDGRFLNRSLEKLLKELKDKGKYPQETANKASKVQPLEEVDSRPKRPDIRGWTQTEVSQWLDGLGLERISNKAKNRLDGSFLVRLQRLKKESPDFFYASLKADLQLCDVFDVLKFTDALDQLVEG